jgi:uncharacterized protein
MIIKIKVKPNAMSNEVKKLGENYYEVKVTVVPEKGKTNAKVIEALSKYFRVPKSSIEIRSGGKSREKVIKLP